MADTEKPKNFDQFAYMNRYNKENYYRVSVLLNRQKDSDMIEHLKSKDSKSEYIKGLIRKDMDQ